MLTSDAHGAAAGRGGRAALAAMSVPLLQNITEKAPAKFQAGLSSELTETFNCKTIEGNRKKRDQIFSDYKDIAESAMICLVEGFKSVMIVMALPAEPFT